MPFFPNPRKLVPTKLNEFTVAKILLKVALDTKNNCVFMLTINNPNFANRIPLIYPQRTWDTTCK